ncbi:hypothetical protein HNP84_001850 [Thermocatellispora tengchongensis]|uniref:Uncharacterized protein n=1 Tax=Thermocatellispora tengchongensis TaxID=1073253 RepID=A0A840P4I0_9ACTN|nr:hypothetical protein [Thermocatellispora tengchongensis]MBB5132137.1 hypothetical protein [Thermocatellispora tengchongensis]
MTPPLGRFEAERVGRIGRLVVQGVRAVVGVPEHLLHPLVTAYVTPVTVVLVSLAFDWRLGAALPRSPGRCSRTPRSCCSTRPPPPWTRRTRPPSPRRCTP